MTSIHDLCDTHTFLIRKLGSVPLAFASERFSLGCRKTKTEVLTLADHKRRRQSNEPITP